MDITTALLCILLLIFVYYRTHQDRKWQLLGKIPGPWIWPVVGNLGVLLDRGPGWNTTWRLARKYGPVMRLQFGPIPIVILNTREVIYEAIVTNGKKLLTRPALTRVGMAFPQYQDVIFGKANDQWKILRRAFIQNFKYYGSGRSHLEPIIMDVLQDFMQALTSTNGNAVDPRPMIFKYFATIIFVLDFGKKPTDENLDLMSIFDQEGIKYLNPFGDGLELDGFPWIQKVGMFKTVTSSLHKAAKNGATIWQNNGENITVNPDHDVFSYEEGKIREPCFAATLKKLISTNEKNGIGVQHARGVTSDTFAGGVSTSTESLHVLLNVLIHYPQVQTKLQKEVDEKLGENYSAMITNDLKDEMPYLQATVYELMRFVSILPFGLPHETEEDVVISGYLIPKGTILITNLWYLHRDDHWDEPFEFKPERFLDDEGNFVSADHPNRLHMMAFGAGPRVCAGKVLAINRLFITIGNLVRQFSVQRDPDRDLVSCDPRDGIPGVLVHVKRYTAKFISRP